MLVGLVKIVRFELAPMTVQVGVFATTPLAIVNLVSLEPIAQSAHAQTNAQATESALIGHVFVIMVSWELIVP
jgi:hypothetical protein